MQEQEFNKIISDLVLSFENTGVYTPELKKTIDSLFDLKNAVLIRNAGTSYKGDCFRCANFGKDETCSVLTGIVADGIQIELPPARKTNLKVKVPMTFSCKFYKY
jgi:hypothetical protein